MTPSATFLATIRWNTASRNSGTSGRSWRKAGIGFSRWPRIFFANEPSYIGYLGRRSEPVLFRATRDADPPVLDHEVVVGRGDVHPAGFQLVAVDGVHGREETGAGQDVGEDALAHRRDVQHHEHRGSQVVGQPTDDRRQCVDTPRRCAKDNQGTGLLVPLVDIPHHAPVALQGTPSPSPNLLRRICLTWSKAGKTAPLLWFAGQVHVTWR